MLTTRSVKLATPLLRRHRGGPRGEAGLRAARLDGHDHRTAGRGHHVAVGVLDRHGDVGDGAARRARTGGGRGEHELVGSGRCDHRGSGGGGRGDRARTVGGREGVGARRVEDRRGEGGHPARGAGRGARGDGARAPGHAQVDRVVVAGVRAGLDVAVGVLHRGGEGGQGGPGGARGRAAPWRRRPWPVRPVRSPWQRWRWPW